VMHIPVRYAFLQQAVVSHQRGFIRIHRFRAQRQMLRVGALGWWRWHGTSIPLFNQRCCSSVTRHRRRSELRLHVNYYAVFVPFKHTPRAAKQTVVVVNWNSLLITPHFESGKSSAGDKPDAEIKITASWEITA
jgi:hypothetical protein